MTEYWVGGRGFQILENYFEGLVQRLQRAVCHPEATHEHCNAPCNAFENIYVDTAVDCGSNLECEIVAFELHFASRWKKRSVSSN